MIASRRKPVVLGSLFGLAVAAAAMLAGPAASTSGQPASPPPQQPPPTVPGSPPATAPAPLPTKDISLAQAMAALQAAQAKAGELNIKQNIAVVDAGGTLKAFARMDGAWLGSVDIAEKKARTARLFDMPTGELGKLSQPGGPLYGIEVSNRGLITFPGGIPLRSADGLVIGAIGVSGSTVENDHAVATAGAAVVK
ncbi:MAG TPA: heme-binding protein [Humisphaera sp.]